MTSFQTLKALVDNINVHTNETYFVEYDRFSQGWQMFVVEHCHGLPDGISAGNLGTLKPLRFGEMKAYMQGVLSAMKHKCITSKNN